MNGIGERLGSIGQQVAKNMQKSGLMLAVVTNITDPDNLGRIKCKPVSEDPEVAETDWCFCLTPAGGKNYGFFFFPHVDDLVVLAFLNGDVHHPLVIGHYWADTTSAPAKIEDGKNEIGLIKTPNGTEIRFVDTKEKEKLILSTPSESELHIDDEAKTIQFKDKGFENALTLNWEKGEIELKAKTKLTLSAGETSIVLESSGKITGKGSGAVSFDGSDIALKGKASFKAQGATAEVKADGQLTLQGGGIAQLKGATVKIN